MQLKFSSLAALAGLAGTGLAVGCNTTTTDRVIDLKNIKFNGTTEVEFTSPAVGNLDFFKLNPAPNETTFDSWYFDAMNPETNETVVFNFEIQWPIDNGASTPDTIYHVSIFGSFANGTSYSYSVEATDARITERADKSMRVDFFGGPRNNTVSWAGSSLLQPKPVYVVTIDAPEVGVVGTITLRGNGPAPHFACGTDAAGVDERIIPGTAWANALPDANATVALRIGGAGSNSSDAVTLDFEGYGYHDKTWVDRPFQTATQAAFWGHARVGPYAVVWWHARAQDTVGGQDVSAEYLATWADGHVIASRCVVGADNNTLGWGEGQIWPLVVGTPPPAGMAINWDLGSAGTFELNLTSQEAFVNIPYWSAGRGPVTGGFVGEESYADVTGLWSLNQLPIL